MTTLQSHTGTVQGQNRVFPVYFSHTGKNLFSLQGSQVKETGFSLLGKVHRENPVLLQGWVCSASQFYALYLSLKLDLFHNNVNKDTGNQVHFAIFPLL